ncbi:fluoride efflux transporter FluC [Virgisporangium ochraceum]|uniref:Fluoride-specific ion channel FluC n=1 Tax=Virgisporangium ochraceum TaxID=65505 RepID=A0A8J3ZSF0_9ACTN|nr:CrcB family protein [Virgisporangium ochraceum]GIJ67193.1 putative fluoride ion transporter CrcB [Virgisporangium ochraceum]
MRWAPVVAVAAGGVVGALGRYGLQSAFPSLWTTWAINVAGCLLIGALMPLVAERPLLQPFVGPGVLGGFTTFSAYAVDVQRGAPLLYLGGTVVAAVAAVWVGRAVTGRLAR